jgi:ubiquinone/menaquinone biosynthesis C-methylase UbiE
MQIPLDDYSFKLFLDAGAGTGQLTCTIAEKMNCNIVGVDLTLGIIKGEYLRRSLKNKDNILFVQANIMELPFEKRVFDYIHSSGVIHHTPDTYKAFCSIEEYTKPGGKLGVWIYRKAETKIPLIPFVKNPQLQLIESKTRKITTKMNRRLLYVLIYIYSSIFHFSYKMNELLRGKKHNQTIKERTTSLFDALAPPYAHKHEPSELVSWFKEKGYKDLTETDQENTAGFNICAIKI